MTMTDADKMLEWKNYPETRKFAIASHDEIKKEDHYQWLEKNLIWIKVIETTMDGGIPSPIGAVRIFGKEVSIWVDRSYHGLGVATQVLKSLNEPGLWAKIVDGNVASMRAFVKAGFVPVAHESSEPPFYVLKK